MVASVQESPRSALAAHGDGRPIRVMLLISSLEHGGAEQQVVQLANHVDPARFEVHICSLSSRVPLGENLQGRDRQLHILEKRNRFDAGLIWRAARLMKALRIDVVHAYLFDAEMVGRLGARLAGVPVMISSERNTDYRSPLVKRIGFRLTRGCFDVMVANSNAGKWFNVKTKGLAAERIRVVHNGVDVERFRPVDGSGFRRDLGVEDDDLVVGMVASIKRQKNHPCFFRMAERVARRQESAFFVCVGEPLRDSDQSRDGYADEVGALVQSLSLGDRLRIVGNRDDMPAVYSAFDVLVLPSHHEGTPNVLLEAMACGVPVVTTDVSDNAYVVRDGETGFVVSPDDDAALAERVNDLLADRPRREAMGAAARDWVGREFSPQRLARKMEAIYAERVEHYHAVRSHH